MHILPSSYAQFTVRARTYLYAPGPGDLSSMPAGNGLPAKLNEGDERLHESGCDVVEPRTLPVSII